MKLLELLVDILPKLGGWRRIKVCKYEWSFIIVGDVAEGLMGIHLQRVTRSQYESALAASQRVEWGGSGLPPVGCECLVKAGSIGNQSWVCCSIVYSGLTGVAFVYSDGQTLDCVGSGGEDYFRPIRSEADKTRDAVAEALICFLDTKTNIDNVFTIEDVSGFFDYISAGEIPHIRIE